MCYWCEFKNKIKNLSTRIYNLAKIFFCNILKIVGISIIIFMVFAISLFIFSKCNIQTPSDVESQEIFICGISLNNWGTWITLIGLIFTAIWSMHQYKKSQLSKQQEKASEIAQDFANNLIERMGLISDVLMPNQEIENMLKKIDSSKLCQFTRVEISEIMNDNQCFQKFHKILYSKRTQKRYNEILHKRYSESELERFDSYFPLLVENTLNKLEAICINISSQAAGSQFIYQSLHQVFLSTIEVLAIHISTSNTNNVDKYYINIISVYNMWNLQKQKDINKLNKTGKKIDKLERQANKEIKKLLNKQTKTV